MRLHPQPLLPDTSHKPFIINTCKSVSKQTTLTTFRINTYKKTGGTSVRTTPAPLSPVVIIPCGERDPLLPELLRFCPVCDNVESQHREGRA
jgi:hypothetical protein